MLASLAEDGGYKNGKWRNEGRAWQSRGQHGTCDKCLNVVVGSRCVRERDTRFPPRPTAEVTDSR